MEEINLTIQEILNQIEQNHNVQILLAVESGSRVWGFHSENSDYDIRFIYKHPKNHYLSLYEPRDTIETMKQDKLLDFSGWDLRKTLKLMYKGNPALFEWIYSPIIYKCDANFITVLKDLSKRYFQLVPMIYHYLHMAKGNYKQYFKNRTDNEGILKKYLYVIRPLLICRWLEIEKSIPPIKFDELFPYIDKTISPFVYDLIEKKKGGDEMSKCLQIPELNIWIENTITHFEYNTKQFHQYDRKQNIKHLQKSFIEILDEYEQN